MCVCGLLTIYTRRSPIRNMQKPFDRENAGAPRRAVPMPRAALVPKSGSAARSNLTQPANGGAAAHAGTASHGAAAIALVQSSSLPMLVQKELARMILAGDL